MALADLAMSKQLLFAGLCLGSLPGWACSNALLAPRPAPLFVGQTLSGSPLRLVLLQLLLASYQKNNFSHNGNLKKGPFSLSRPFS
jgi:hypothetical protein